MTPIAIRKFTLELPRLLLLPLLLLILWAPQVLAGDEPFTFPSNLGLTGLLETTTARVMKENRYRLGASQVHPYRIYYGTVGIFDRLEVNGRVTEVIGVPGFNAGSPYGDFKDKAVDIKLQVLPEGKYTPALAVGILDPHGTRVYASQVLVASKQVHPFDFTIGLGNGRLGKNALPPQGEGFGIELFSNPKQWWREAQFFGGIQFAPSERFALVAEYSPIRYDRQTSDPAQPKYFTSPVPSHFNYGIRWKPTRWSEIDASWQRGDQFGISASVAFDIGKPLIPIYDAPYREPASRRPNPVSERIADALRESGFSDIGVEADGATLWIEAQNDKYYFNARAIEVILDILAERMPDSVDYVRITIKENGIPLGEFITTASAIAALHAREIPRNRFFEASSFKTSDSGTHVKETVHRRRFDYGLKPSVDTFLNDPSGYFKYRIGLSGWLTAQTWKGGSAILGLEGYPVNTVSTSNTPLSIPVRSDIADYKKENVALGRLMAEQILKTRDPIFGRLSAGLLEVEYAGVDGEVAIPLFRGRILAGVGGSIVVKRDPNDPFKFKESDRFHTSFLNTRLNLPEHNVFVDVKAGRFLAGDKGARVTLSKFVNGVVLS
ncbi:MAG TPA: YjbH domain-containing protein, partial [Candidatus Deferrimicrobiaceae bacterium]|nr:YjbH domain-containing protein [Candidatus Deferrimicrobiaceae bacterium]